MATFVNRAKVATSTTGTGTITLGAAEDGYQTFAAAGVADGNTVRYTIEDGSDWEIGTGTYTATGTTLSRNPSESSNAGAAINLSGNAIVFVTALATDFTSPTYTNLTATGTVDFTGATVSDLGTVTTANIDGGDIASAVTINKSPTVTLTGAITGSGTLTNLGNVSIATTATSDPTLTLSGDATGSATFTNLGNATLAVTVVGGDVDTATTATTASTANAWTTARTVSLTGAVTGSASVDGSANVSIATTATSDPTLTLSGDATGSATFTNLGNATLSVSVVNDSHTHAFNNLTSKTGGTGTYYTSGIMAGLTLQGGTSTTLAGAGQVTLFGPDPYIAFFPASSTTRYGYLQKINTGGYFFFGEESYVRSDTSFRAPVFYDQNNTSYYVDAAGTSSLSVVAAAGRIYTGYDANIANSVSCSNWFRSNGATGWYNATYAGGIYMQDTTYVRIYNSKVFYADNYILSGNSVRAPIFYDSNNTAYYTDPASTSILNNLRYNPDPGSITTAAHEGSINYVYNSAGGTPTRGDCSVHVYHVWSTNLSLNLTSSTWQTGDIVRVSNAKGTQTITVTATRIYLPDGNFDTSVTFNNAVGGFVLAKYTSTTGYWMVMP